MSKLKVSAIHDPDNDNTALTIDTSGNVTVSEGFVPPTQLSHRNIIINGDFKVSQRGDYTSATAITNGNYYLDRWECVSATVSGTVLDNSDASVTLTATSSATGSLRLRQRIEYTVNNYAGKQYTLSAQVKSNSTNARLNVYAGSFLTMTGNTTHTGGGDWETLTATVTTPDPITPELSVHIGIDGVNSADVSITSGDYVQIKEVQLELGSVATPFEHRSYGEELVKCQRYFLAYHPLNESSKTIGLGYMYTTNYVRMPCRYPVEMRTTPTLSVANSTSAFICIPDNITFDTFSLSGNTNARVATIFNNALSSGTAKQAHEINSNSTSAYIHFDAELG